MTMPEVAVVNAEGGKAGKIELPAEIFERTPHGPLMHRAVVMHLANRRSGTADTLTRSEVAGGGKKPYRQKGTGRARQGTIRAPHYAGGGVVFGPHPRNYDQKLPKKMRRIAINSAFSTKLAEEKVLVLDELTMDAISTKKLVAILEKLGVEGKTMLVLGAPDETIRKSARNIPWVMLRVAPSISAYDILNSDVIVLTKDAVSKIGEAQAK
jgi:large subunit ribosomal protein L4